MGALMVKALEQQFGDTLPLAPDIAGPGKMIQDGDNFVEHETGSSALTAPNSGGLVRLIFVSLTGAWVR